MVIWLIGMSGAGKTTIGRELFEVLKKSNNATVLVDGDDIRALYKFDQPTDFSIKGRMTSARRLQEICMWLEKQGIDVVCCNLGIFDKINQENRKIFSRYFEIFVDVPLQTLIEQDNKGLYQSALAGDQSNVIGIDIPYVQPSSPDLIIKNSYNASDVTQYVHNILAMLNKS